LTSSVQQSICHALFCFSYFPLRTRFVPVKSTGWGTYTN
jgi:hypothetical protein